MPESVADQLGRLRFVSGPVETLYLNETRTREDFIGQLGAIESFTRSAIKEGRIELPFLRVGGGVGAEAGVTWSLTDPIAQALVLRAALESADSLVDVREAAPGRYVQCAGRGQLSRPAMFDESHRMALQPEVYEELEAERAKQEEVLKMIGQGEAKMWLMTVENDTSMAAAVLDGRWLRPNLGSWLGGQERWDVFARARGKHQTGVPLLAALHITVTWE
jgi:hypothetical protein